MISLDPCILMVTQMISQLVSSSGLWVPMRSFFMVYSGLTPLELSDIASLDGSASDSG